VGTNRTVFRLECTCTTPGVLFVEVMAEKKLLLASCTSVEESSDGVQSKWEVLIPHSRDLHVQLKLRALNGTGWGPVSEQRFTPARPSDYDDPVPVIRRGDTVILELLQTYATELEKKIQELEEMRQSDQLQGPDVFFCPMDREEELPGARDWLEKLNELKNITADSSKIGDEDRWIERADFVLNEINQSIKLGTKVSDSEVYSWCALVYESHLRLEPWAMSVMPLWDQLETSLPNVDGLASPQTEWAEKKAAWCGSFDLAVNRLVPESVSVFMEALSAVRDRSTMRSQRATHVLAMHRDLLARFDQQVKKLTRACDLVGQANGAETTRGFAEKQTLEKIESTIYGILVSLVMPIPGSLEVMALHAGATMFEDDIGKKHVVVEHSTESSIAEQIQGFDLTPPAHVMEKIPEWQRSGEKTIIFHNAASRSIVVTLNTRDQSGVLDRVVNAHPYSKTLMGMLNSTQQDNQFLLRPGELTVSFLEEDNVHAQIAYGSLKHPEKEVGRVDVAPGRGYSFLCLIGDVFVRPPSGGPVMGGSSPVAVPAQADGGAENAATEEKETGGEEEEEELYFEVSNRSFKPAKLRVFHFQAHGMLKSALLDQVVSQNEVLVIKPPGNAEKMWTVEVNTSEHKRLVDVASGYTIQVEECL
jgi:hypothetical protein